MPDENKMQSGTSWAQGPDEQNMGTQSIAGESPFSDRWHQCRPPMPSQQPPMPMQQQPMPQQPPMCPPMPSREKTGRGLAIAAFIISIIALLIAIGSSVVSVVGLGVSAYDWADDSEPGYIEDDSPFGRYDDDSYDDELARETVGSRCDRHRRRSITGQVYA